MSALNEALPLALGAAIYPPALLVLLLLLTGEHPRRLVLAYFAGAALMVVAAGLIALVVLKDSGASAQNSSSASGGVKIAFSLLMFALSAWLWHRRTHRPDKVVAREPAKPGRIAEWSHRATTSQKWSFALGIAMFLPSPLYLLAVQEIVDSGSSKSSQILAVLICAMGVLIFLEITVVALFVRPGSVASGLERTQAWLANNGWTLGAIVSFIAGVVALVEGIEALT